MEESISHNAGKVLLKIYLIYTKENKLPDFKELSTQSGLDENKLMRALDYCHDKHFIELKVTKFLGGNSMYDIRRITSEGIDIIEAPAEKPEEKRPFNITFNFNNEFNVESIIKGEAKLF